MTNENGTTRNPFQFLHENGMMPLYNYGTEIGSLRGTLRAIQAETVPVAGHPDPLAIRDCWDEVFETIDRLDPPLDRRPRGPEPDPED